MEIYIIILLVLILLAKYDIKENYPFLLVLFILSFVVGFRSEYVGKDTASYIYYYEYSNGYMELGWNYLVLLSNQLQLSAYFFNYIVATISLALIGYTINKEINNRMLSIFFFYSLGFYFLMFNGMRQMLAISLVFFAFSYLHSNKYLIFIMIVLATSLIHFSSLYVLPLVFCNQISFNKFILPFLLLGSLLIGFVLSEDLFVSFAGKYAHDVTEDTSWGGFRESLSLVYTLLIIQNAFLLFVYYISPTQLKNNFWMKIFIVSMILSNLLIRLTLGPRLIYYFSISQIILFTYYSKNRLISLILFVYAIVNYLRFLLPELKVRDGSLIPYSMHFELFN